MTAILNQAALELLQQQGSGIVDSPFFPRLLVTQARELQRRGARGISDAQLAAAVGEGAQLAGLGGPFSKIKRAFKKIHVVAMKPLTNSVRIPQDLFNKLGAPAWANRVTDLLSEIPAKPWENKKAVMDVASGFLSGSWVGMAIAAAALVAQNEVMHRQLKQVDRLNAEAAAFGRLTDAQKAEALAALGAAIALRLKVPETDEGRKQAETYATAVGALWSQGKSPARAIADVLAAETMLRQGVDAAAPDYLVKHTAISDAIEIQLAAGVGVPDVALDGIPPAGAARPSSGGGMVGWLLAAGAAAATGHPIIAAGLVGAPLALKAISNLPRDIVGPTAPPPASSSPTIAPPVPMPKNPGISQPHRRTGPFARRDLMGLEVDADQLLADHFEWARIRAPLYYGALQRQFDHERTIDGLGWGWVANIGTVIQALGSAAQVYGSVRGAENEKKLVNAQIDQMRRLTAAQTAAPVSTQVLPSAAGMNLQNLQSLVLPLALAGGAALFFSRRRR